MHQSEQTFLLREDANYATAWALTHFLRQESIAGKAVIQRIHAGLQERLDTQAALARSLEGLNVKALQKEFFDWVGATLREGRTR